MKSSKNKMVHNFIIGTFVSLYVLVSLISTVHVVSFFALSNPYWMAVALAVAFEIGAAASLASLVILEKMNKSLIWALFIGITLFQIQGNLYYAFVHIEDYGTWSQLFNIVEWEPIAQKRMMAMISGGILPLIALGFIKSLVDYIKPDVEEDANEHQHIMDNVDNNTTAIDTPEFTKDEITPDNNGDINYDEGLVDEHISDVAPSKNVESIEKEEIIEDRDESTQTDTSARPHINSLKKIGKNWVS